MTPSARLAASLELLENISSTPRPADALVSAYFRARRFIGSKDRAAISEFVYDTLRHFGRLNWWAERLAAQALGSRALFLLYLFLARKMTTEEIAELFNGTRHAPAALTDEEKSLLRRLKGHTLFHPAMPKAAAFECPPWAFKGLAERFADGLEKELEALLRQAPLDLRVNPLKISRDEALESLRAAGLFVEKTPFSSVGLRVLERPSLGDIALLKSGALEIQDEGSQLVAALLAPEPGMRVMDFCAGAGGKTLAMAALMRNKGRLCACDVLAKRLEQAAKRCSRAGFHNVTFKTLSSERDPWVKRHKGAFERVLVDAPCSGVGTWRRNPDARWRALGPGLEALIPLQRSILDSAARLAAKGGRLVYATCSLLPEENEAQVMRFLDNNPDFRAIPVRSIVPDLPDTGDFMALSPAVHETDGFFAAVMERTSELPQEPLQDSDP